MTFRVRVPAGLEAERRHVVSMVLGGWLGVPHNCVVDPTLDDTAIDDGGPRSLRVADKFFTGAEARWLSPDTVPTPPFTVLRTDALPAGFRALHEQLPVLFGAGDPWTNEGSYARLGLDVFGAVFFLTSLYHEAATPTTDAHGRYPLTSSLLKRADLLARPLANEYVEVLRSALAHVFPGLATKQHQFRVFSTHDVDRPLQLFYCAAKDLPRAVASAVREARDPAAAVRVLQGWRRVRTNGAAADPTNNFNQIISADERAGAESAFYFIPDPDPVGRVRRQVYRLSDAPIQEIIRRITGTGHEVGFHPSYGAYGATARLVQEADALRTAVASVAPGATVRGGRQHFLRWDSRSSPRTWQAAGLEYDSTIGYAEEPGFRTGACMPFPLFDLDRHQPLQVSERPLLLMDVSLTDPAYLGLAPDGANARQRIDTLREACRHFGGEFVVLWHNDVLARPGQWDLYQYAIGRAVN